MKSRKLIGIISVVIGVVLSLSLLLLNIIQNRQITPVYVTSKTVAAGAYLNEKNEKKGRIFVGWQKVFIFVTVEKTIID